MRPPHRARRAAYLLAAVTAGLLAARAAPAQAGPQRPPPAADSARVAPPAVIALRPTELPDDTPDAARARATFDSLITALLTGAGYRVVPSDTAAAAWKAAVDSMGGYFDRSTGRLIREKYVAATTSALARLRASHGAEVLLSPMVMTDVVRTDRGKAKWDGVSQQVDHGGFGTVGVLSLRVLTFDGTGTVIQCGAGGIRALVKFSYLKNDAKPLPPAEYFADRERNATAVRLALGSLIARAPACD